MTKPSKARGKVFDQASELGEKPKRTRHTPELRRRAEARLLKLSRTPPAEDDDMESTADAQRLLHELQVHQIELEMQNAELQENRERTEAMLERYTDLYDFAPVGYFSVDERGRILETNLTGAALLGVERPQLINRSLSRFVSLSCRSAFLQFLGHVFAGSGDQSCEAKLEKNDGASFWAGFHGVPAVLYNGQPGTCRLAVSDITSLKQAEDIRRDLEVALASNAELEKEIAQRQAAERALKASDRRQRRLLQQSRRQQEELRYLSRRIIQTREEERKRISRELHDHVIQTLVGIGVQLETLTAKSPLNPDTLKRRVSETKRLVAESVDAIHQLAVELRPSSLDDLGLIVTLNTLLNGFQRQTGIRVHFEVSADVEKLNSEQGTTLYRIVEAALANIAKHAQASRTELSIFRAADDVHLEISDNGKSFNVKRALNVKNTTHLGLLGMRERAEMMGGAFAVESEPGKGTTVRVHIPLDNGAK